MQNDFADPGGSLYVEGGEQILDTVNNEITQALQSGALVVYTQDWHPPTTPHFAKDGGIWPVHCVQETWGASFVPGLVVEGPVVKKGTGGEDGYSGFAVRDPSTGAESPTELQELLSQHGVDEVTIIGLALDYCVKETALDAARLGFETSLLSHATRAVNLDPSDGDKAVEELAGAAVSIVDPP